MSILRVSDLQRALTQYRQTYPECPSPGPIDNTWGPRTVDAYQCFARQQISANHFRAADSAVAVYADLHTVAVTDAVYLRLQPYLYRYVAEHVRSPVPAPAPTNTYTGDSGVALPPGMSQSTSTPQPSIPSPAPSPAPVPPPSPALASRVNPWISSGAQQPGAPFPQAPPSGGSALKIALLVSAAALAVVGTYYLVKR